MSKEKQIEEMAKVIQNGEIARNRGDLDCTEFPTDIVIKVGLQRLAGAKALYNEGYRKASEVAREIFEEIEKALNLSKCYGDSGVYFERDMETDIAELKKKYVGDKQRKEDEGK